MFVDAGMSVDAGLLDLIAIKVKPTKVKATENKCKVRYGLSHCNDKKCLNACINIVPFNYHCGKCAPPPLHETHCICTCSTC